MVYYSAQNRCWLCAGLRRNIFQAVSPARYYWSFSREARTINTLNKYKKVLSFSPRLQLSLLRFVSCLLFPVFFLFCPSFSFLCYSCTSFSSRLLLPLLIFYPILHFSLFHSSQCFFYSVSLFPFLIPISLALPSLLCSLSSFVVLSPSYVPVFSFPVLFLLFVVLCIPSPFPPLPMLLFLFFLFPLLNSSPFPSLSPSSFASSTFSSFCLYTFSAFSPSSCILFSLLHLTLFIPRSFLGIFSYT